MKVRFLVNRATQKILYMEAGNNFVNLLLGFLQLSVVSILKVFNGSMEVGSISNIYESLLKLIDSSLLLLLPVAFAPAANPAMDNAVVYRCRNSKNCHLSSVLWFERGCCDTCNAYSMTKAMPIEPPSKMPVDSSVPLMGGIVEHYLSFIIINDLNILPASTIESIVLLNKLKVDKMSDLESVEAVVPPYEASIVFVFNPVH
ncbi:hypothetical protein L7F22_049033 [Adiantum nelumboides]|nr:hypothetical protein [Adiantum nelumboides]